MRILMIIAGLTLTAAPALAQTGGADAPLAAVALKAEAHAKPACHPAERKGAACGAKARKGAAKSRSATPMITQCRDVISHRLARCGGPNAEPVPAN